MQQQQQQQIYDFNHLVKQLCAARKEKRHKIMHYTTNET